MANTLNGMAVTAIANKGLKAFNLALAPMINVFTTDFSKEADRNTKIQTRVIPASGAAVALADYGNDRTNANVSGDTATTLVEITMADYAVGFHLSDAEISGIAEGVVQDTKDKLIEKKANALARKIQDLAFATITNSNFGATVSNVAASSFDYEVVSDLRTAVNKLGWEGDQFIVLNSDYMGSLRKDSAIAGQLGSAIVQTGEIGAVAGFKAVEAPLLPDNSENLAGFIATPDAIAIACRPTYCQAPEQLAAYEVVQDPKTGLVLVLRAFYVAATGEYYFTLECNAGVAKGVATALKRITSA